MKFFLLLLPLFISGCTITDCNSVFPKLDWYWSAEAIECRREHKVERQQEAQYKHFLETNSVNINK